MKYDVEKVKAENVAWAAEHRPRLKARDAAMKQRRLDAQALYSQITRILTAEEKELLSHYTTLDVAFIPKTPDTGA